MLVGYGRVSTLDQRLELQRDALTQAQCEMIFEDKMTGRRDDRPGLRAAIDKMQPGDTLVVWKLSRLGRSLRQLLDTVQLLSDKGIALKSLHELVDTSTATGKLVFHIFAAIAQFESDNDRENTLAGLAAARLRGRKGGRPSVMDARKQALARQLLSGKPRPPVSEICRQLHISKATLYRHLSSVCDGSH